MPTESLQVRWLEAQLGMLAHAMDMIDDPRCPGDAGFGAGTTERLPSELFSTQLLPVPIVAAPPGCRSRLERGLESVKQR